MKNAATARKMENPAQPPCNIVVAGLGGQGVLTATDIMADVAVRAGFDVKKSAIKGMSQRGGSVTCDVRFGARSTAPWCRRARRIFFWCLNRRKWNRTAICCAPRVRPLIRRRWTPAASE